MIGAFLNIIPNLLICNVAHPNFIGRRWYQFLYLVGICGQSMARVRCTRLPAGRTYSQLVPWDNVLETAMSHGVLFSKLLAIHQPEFTTTDTGILLSNRLNIFYNKWFLCQSCQRIIFVLIICLTSIPKQLAESRNAIVAGFCTKLFYCLGPDFFRTGIL